MRIREKGDNCHIYWEGEINASSVEKFQDDIFAAQRETDKNIVLNLNGVGYINSRGLGVVAELYNRLKEEGRTLRIVCNSPFVREVIEVVKFDRVIPVFSSEEEII